MKKILVSVAAAAMALSTTVVAEESKASDLRFSDLKVSGHLKLWYQTMDHQGMDDNGLFRYDGKSAATRNEWGDVAAQLKITGNANDHVSFGISLNAVSSFGLGGHIVGSETTRTNGAGIETGQDKVPFWFHEAYVAYKTGNTTVKVGRQELDTPLAYTEKWNATSNSFEAAVVLNSDIPDTTLVGAWVSKGNGTGQNVVGAPQVFGATDKYYGFMQFNQDLSGYGGPADFKTKGGALVLAAINKSVSSMPIQLWGYHVPQVANAAWLQADFGMKDMSGLDSLGVQLIGATIGTQGLTEKMLKNDLGVKTDYTSAVAGKIGANAGAFDFHVAASMTTEGNLPVANTATNFKKTKLPTASIFSDGMVAAQPDTTAFKVGAGMKLDGIGKVSASYGTYTVGKNKDYLTTNAAIGGPASFGWIANTRGKDMDINEFDLVFNTKFKDINFDIMYIYVDSTYVPGAVYGGKDYTTAGADYGDAANHIIRAIATLNF